MFFRQDAPSFRRAAKPAVEKFEQKPNKFIRRLRVQRKQSNLAREARERLEEERERKERVRKKKEMIRDLWRKLG